MEALSGRKKALSVLYDYIAMSYKKDCIAKKTIYQAFSLCLSMGYVNSGLVSGSVFSRCYIIYMIYAVLLIVYLLRS